MDSNEMKRVHLDSNSDIVKQSMEVNGEDIFAFVKVTCNEIDMHKGLDEGTTVDRLQGISDDLVIETMTKLTNKSSGLFEQMALTGMMCHTLLVTLVAQMNYMEGAIGIMEMFDELEGDNDEA